MNHTPHLCDICTNPSWHDEARARVMISSDDIEFQPEMRPEGDLLGALEVWVLNDGDMIFQFILLSSLSHKVSYDLPEFQFDDDFIAHMENESQLPHGGIVARKFDLNFDLSKVFVENVDEEEHSILVRQLAGIWLAKFLATNFRFAAKLKLNGDKIKDGAYVELTMTRPWSGASEVFRANLTLDEDILTSEFFGKAA